MGYYTWHVGAVPGTKPVPLAWKTGVLLPSHSPPSSCFYHWPFGTCSRAQPPVGVLKYGFVHQSSSMGSGCQWGPFLGGTPFAHTHEGAGQPLGHFCMHIHPSSGVPLSCSNHCPRAPPADSYVTPYNMGIIKSHSSKDLGKVECACVWWGLNSAPHMQGKCCTTESQLQPYPPIETTNHQGETISEK